MPRRVKPVPITTTGQGLNRRPHATGIAPDRLATLQTSANRNPALQRLRDLQPEAELPTAEPDSPAAQSRFTSPALNSLAGLQRAANANPQAGRLRALHGALPTAESEAAAPQEREVATPAPRPKASGTRPSVRPGGSAHRPVAQRHRAPAGTWTSRTLRTTTILQRAPAPTGQVRTPAFIGACNTPVHSPELTRQGARAAVMSNADYAAWKGTIQCRLAPHGASRQGNTTLVTQYNNPTQVIQGWFLSKNTKGLLLYLEGGLTLLAGLTALGVAVIAGPAAFPAVFAGLMSVGVGISKIWRGYLMRSGDPAPDPALSPAQNRAVAAQTKADRRERMDQLRAFEALLATLGAMALAFDPKATATAASLIVFGVAKGVRSFATWLAKDDPEGTTSTAAKVAAAAHVVETAALFFAGGFSLDAGISGGAELALNGGPKIGAGASFVAVGLSKGVRAADQTKDAFFPAGPAAAAPDQVQNAGPPPPPNGGGQNGVAVNPQGAPDRQPQQAAVPANAQANAGADNALMQAWLRGMFDTYPNLQQFHLDTVTDADIGEFTRTGAIAEWQTEDGAGGPKHNAATLHLTGAAIQATYPRDDLQMADLSNDQIGEFLITGRVAAWEALRN